MSVETRRKEREPKTETEKALMAQKTKEGLQGLAIGPVTGLLGLPSDIIDLADMANDAIAKYGEDTTIAQFSKLIKPQLDAVQEKYGRDAFDKGFTELTGIKSDPTKPAQFLGELVSLGSIAKTGVKGAKLVGETISDTYKGAKKLFEDSTLPPPDNLAAQTVGATKPVDQLEQTKKLLDKEKAITTEAPNIIPPDEFINAPKTTRMSMAGNRTPTGKQQITKYRELDKTKKYNPDELFEMTGVYKGSDGEFRWEIDTTDAELKGLNIIKNAKDGDAVALSSILKFDRLYQEYFEPLKVRKLLSRYNYKPMKNVSVVLRKGTDEDGRALAAYTPSSDVITLYTDRIYNATLDAANKAQDFKNIDKLYEYQLESTLLHEIQHAIQGREGFTRGSATQNFIRSGYEQDIKTNNELLDQSYFRFFNEFESENALTGLSGRDRLDKVSNYVKLAFEENPNLSDGAINSIIKAEIRNLDRAGVGLSSVKKEQVLRSYFSNIQRHYKNKKILDDEYDTAYKSYRDVYGEKEANLVQKRFEERRNLRALMSMDTGQATKSDIEKVQKEMRQKPPPSDMMGLTRSERERQDVLARTDPKTGKVKRKISVKILDNEKFTQEIKQIETTPVKKSPALQKISEITKLRDGTLGSRTPMDKDGLPKDLIRDKDGKPLVLYYGDMGQVYDPVTQTYKASDIPGKLTNKFTPSGRTYTIDKKVGNFVTPNPVFASGYASQEGGSVIPVYLIADKVSNIKARSFSDIDKAGGDAKRGEVFIGDVGYDSAAPVKLVDGRKVKDVKARDESIKKYGTEQYTFNRGTQVFSAITGERLTNLPTIDQNIRNKLLKLTQKEEDVLLKKMSPEERIKYKAKKTYTEDLVDDTDFVEDTFKLDRKGDITRNEKKRNLAKGGDMKKQMDLFQEGGLKDEGGTVDPVSGNDVPPGSTQEEVRDDIPAQLSEGEFVFPADVVRFIGLEKLMMLRQEAKAGLKRMEEMGQMGNSDEATLPDDMPFTIDDLDMEDEQEYNQGGVVQAQAGTFVAPGAGITTTPSQFTGQALPSATNIPNYVAPNIPPPAPAPLGGFRPLTTSAQTGQQNTGTTPTFQTLIGRRPGQYDEFREYVNEAGMKLQIPFKDGQPIYPIPEGYTFVDPEEEKVIDPKVTDVKPQTTRVTEESGDDDGDKGKTSAVDLTGAPLSYKSIFDMDKLDTALKDIAFGQLNLFDLKGATMRGITGNVDINNVTLEFQKEVMGKFKDNLVDKYGQNFNLASMNDIERNSLAESLNKSSDMVKNVLTDSNDNPLNTDDLISKANRTYGMSVVKANLMAKGTNVLSRSKITQLAKDMMTKDMEMKERSAKAREVFEDYSDSSSDSEVTQDLSDVVSDRDKAQAAAEAGFNVDETFGGGSAPSSPNFSNVSDDSGGSEPDSGGGYGSDDSGTMGGEEVAKGSLITRRKTSGKLKKKYMKRGGLASR